MISGPLNNGGEVPGSPLIVLEMNETHPAKVRCQATCLGQQGTSYGPAMAVIVTSQEEFIPVYGKRDSFTYSRDGLHFEVRTGNVSYCEAQNNNTMEYEYLITSNSSKTDRSVVFCGIQYYKDWPYNNSYYDLVLRVCTCWGQSYGIIHAEVDTLADYQAPTNPSSTQAAYTSIAVNDCSLYNIILNAGTGISTTAGPGLLQLAYIYILTPIIIILVIIIITITLPLTIGFLYRSHRRQKSYVFAPQCVQIVEQTLVIKVEQPVAIESAAVREKETSFSEKSDSSRSSIQAQLQEKLPDTISSRSKTL